MSEYLANNMRHFTVEVDDQTLAERDAGEDFIVQYSNPNLISHETKPARKRVGNGEILRDGERHDCKPPNAAPGTVWRCDCGRRWANGLFGWTRRYWPWPR